MAAAKLTCRYFFSPVINNGSIVHIRPVCYSKSVRQLLLTSARDACHDVQAIPEVKTEGTAVRGAPRSLCYDRRRRMDRCQ
ncbi:hypothetical protein BRYFOR_06211 [Marvinbryantia formatexigens DSM 14469]|uniref:Uncharacterized protein n=1 Tax=Marvinbryantia formatexigens DSM 14469 TaxID=478749 RepID=C6LC64_9FIRM|nr:hypothetical protein BRYFOR_06211 [Marvinbryantia formatexigens DSM 14469]